MTYLPAAQPLDVTLSESIRKYTRKAKAENTRKAYRYDLEHFAAFCAHQNVPALPASAATIAAYLASMADEGLKPATMSRRLAAISKAHAAAGLETPTSMRHAIVAETWQGIRRTLGTAQVQKAACTTDYMKQMLAQVPDTLAGARDRALLLVGFAAALRRSELVALAVDGVQFVPEGMTISIRRSKTDQEQHGQKVAVTLGKTPETCPVRALKAWLKAASVESGPLFRAVNRWGQVQQTALTDQVVASLVKKYAQAAGLDADVFSGHSLRAGLATSAALAGAGERQIMRQTRHKSEAMVRRYVRDANMFNQNVSGIVGL
ncbi:MAG TPA: site-specific integrase [Bryobacteraceae bacterium]|jgi:site-specific recombinase XerD|nr:site-specific integrase [Bryobacteraceae bacterium]